MNVTIGVKLGHPDAKLPIYATAGANCADVYSVEEVTLLPGQIKPVDIGLYLDIPDGYEVQVRPRSGLSCKGLLVANSPGTLDSDWRGLTKVILMNNSDGEFKINKGERIAQLAPRYAPQIPFELVQEVSKTERGEKGFGSTGLL